MEDFFFHLSMILFCIAILVMLASQNRLLVNLKRKEVRFMATLQDIRDKVAGQTTVIASTKELLKGLSAKITELANKPSIDPAELQALADSIDANTADLSNAVTENTPVA